MIIIHCSAVRPGQTSSAAQIDNVAREYADLQPK